MGEAAAVVLMPEATVDEYGESMPGEDEIGPAGQVLPMQAEPEPHPVRDAANREFRRGVPRPDPGHQLAPSPGVHDVGHGKARQAEAATGRRVGDAAPPVAETGTRRTVGEPRGTTGFLRVWPPVTKRPGAGSESSTRIDQKLSPPGCRLGPSACRSTARFATLG